MRKILIIPFLFLMSLVFAQKHEVGVFLGGANAIADIGSTNYINILPRKVDGKLKIPFVVGGVYRYNLNPQQGLRFNLSYASIADDNKLAKEEYRKYKDTSYANSIIEFSTMFEYNFFPINSEQQKAYSPYIFGGVGVFYQTLNDNNIGKYIKEFFKERLVFPFGLGYKFKFKWNWLISTEVGFRSTVTDSLEEREDDREGKTIGSSKNDWYVFTGITLSYTFGRPPCFCD